jgi:hypothetical protein
MKFTHKYDEKSPEITFEIDKDCTYTEALEAFEAFAIAVGYSEKTVRPGEEMEEPNAYTPLGSINRGLSQAFVEEEYRKSCYPSTTVTL